jgi:hyperosmotically inducible protein
MTSEMIRETMIMLGLHQQAKVKPKTQDESCRRMTMRNKLALLPLLLVLATGVCWAGEPTPDAQTTAGIQSRIYRAHVYKHGDVQVTYANGVATLTGTVDNLGSKLDAEKAAQKVPGVTRVVDNIQVHAKGVTEQQILQQARHEIVMYPYYGIFDNVELQALGDKLTVSGQVTQPFKKTDIGRMLTRVKGVAAVQNNLEVLPNSMFDDRLRLAVARAIYSDPFFIYYADQALPPIHIIVKNGKVTLDGVVASSLDRTKAYLAANSVPFSFSVVDNLRVVRS